MGRIEDESLFITKVDEDWKDIESKAITQISPYEYYKLKMMWHLIHCLHGISQELGIKNMGMVEV